MSVVSRNPFDLLGDDGGDSPAPVAKPSASKPAAAAAAPAATPREVPGSKAPRGRGAAEGGARGGRGGYYSRGGPRNVLKNDGQGPASPSDPAVDPESGFDGERRAPSKTERSFAEGGRGRGRGEGRGRGRGSSRRGAGEGGGGYKGAYASGGGDRRAETRRSGHALPDSEKKIASGWGADEGEAELAAEVEGAKDADAEAAAPGTPAPEAESSPVESAPAAAEDPEAAAAAAAAKKAQEEEDNAKTYDEYLAERAQAALAGGLGKKEGRKVDGVSDFVGSALKKQEEAEWYTAAGKDKTKSDKPKAPKKEKVFIEVEGRFAPPAGSERSERGGGRGGRGGARGGASTRGGGSDRPARGGAARGGRGGARASGPAPIRADDEKAFPALGA